MKKEELIKLLETLELEEIKSLKIVYYKEKHYGMYDNREETILTINEKAIAYLKNKENFDGELFLHTDRLVQKVLLGILEKGEGKVL